MGRYEVLPPGEALKRFAVRRLQQNGGGIGTTVEREMTPNGMDGRRWLLLVTDGERFAWRDAEVARLRGVEVPDDRICAEVERRASSFPSDTRFDDLLALETVVLRADKLVGESN